MQSNKRSYPTTNDISLSTEPSIHPFLHLSSCSTNGTRTKIHHLEWLHPHRNKCSFEFQWQKIAVFFFCFHICCYSMITHTHTTLICGINKDAFCHWNGAWAEAADSSNSTLDATASPRHNALTQLLSSFSSAP